LVLNDDQDINIRGGDRRNQRFVLKSVQWTWDMR
jgi:hypothetical protein